MVFGRVNGKCQIQYFLKKFCDICGCIPKVLKCVLILPSAVVSFRVLLTVGIFFAIGVLLILLLGPGTGPAENDNPPEPKVILPDESQYTAAPSDGKGGVTVTPDTVYRASPVTLTFVYTAGPKGIAVGGGVVCFVSNFWGWAQPQITFPDRPGYVTVSCSNPKVGIDLIIDPTSQAVYARIEKQPLQMGETLVFIYGDTQDGKFPYAKGRADTYAERGERFFFRVDGDGDGFYTPIEHQPYFQVLPGKPFKLNAYAPSRAYVSKTFEIALSVLDRANNLVEYYDGRIKLKVVGNRATLPTEVVFRPKDRGTLRVAVTANSPGIISIEASDASKKLERAISNPTVVAETNDEPLKLYWADLHGHSNYSDGTGVPEDYFRYARDVARLDVVALTDHDNWGYEPLSKSTRLQTQILDVVRRFHEPGKFVTIAGYEWTNWTYGHMHVLFAEDDQTLIIPWNEPLGIDPETLWNALGSRDCITIPHHTGGGPIPFYWKFYNPQFVPVVEITSVHGVSERMGHPQGIDSPVKSGMVQSALARGYRLGLIGSGDTHDGHPGMKSISGGVSGLAGIYARELNREAIFEALRARRVYATSGCRSILRFHMNKTHMGGIAKLFKTDQLRQFTVNVLADSPIAEITMVKNNQNIASKSGDGIFMTWQWMDTEPAKRGDYYYTRVKQIDNQWIYSSPIWIDVD